jgi:hypothetical protein
VSVCLTDRQGPPHGAGALAAAATAFNSIAFWLAVSHTTTAAMSDRAPVSVRRTMCFISVCVRARERESSERANDSMRDR